MSAKQTRGTKRTCQNGECGSRFYDLNRAEIVCPVCNSPYVIASAPLVTGSDRPGRKVKREYVIEEPAPPEAEAETVEGDEALAEVADAEPVAAEADETFLEEEEDGGDVSTIVGGHVEGEEEP